MPDTSRAHRLAQKIAEAVDIFTEREPSTSVQDVLAALCEVDHNLTEAYLATTPFDWRTRDT